MKKEAKSKRLRCGLIMPISEIDGCTETHWEQVRTIIEESLEGTGLSVELVSDADEVGVIQKRIIQNIYDNDIVICDVSCKNPNVMFELGMRLAFDKPAVIIKDDVTSYSFDTSPVEHLTYPRGLHYHQIQDFKKKLQSKVVSTLEAAKKPEYTTFLKHFGKFVVANIDEKTVEKDEYILEAIHELRKDMSRLRMEQHEPHIGYRDYKLKSISELGKNIKSITSPENYVVHFIKQHNPSEADLKLLKDPNSDIFKTLHNDYVEDVLSRAVNPKSRHEAAARSELLKTVHMMLD